MSEASDIEAPEDRRMDPSRPWVRPPHWGQVPPFPRPPMPAPPGPWPAGLFRLEQCWGEIAEWERFLLRMMEDLLQRNPNLISNAMPTIGVTDGAAAQPGQVGEFHSFNAVVNAAAGLSTAVVVVGVLPPGDWDVQAQLQELVYVNSVFARLDPLPAGFTGDLLMSLYSPATDAAISLNSMTEQALTAAPSLMAFTLGINATQAGPIGLRVNARRRR